MVLFQIFVMLFAELRFQQCLSKKKKLQNCEQTVNGIVFCIWLARDNVAWQSVESKSPLLNTHPPESRSPSISKAKTKNNLPNSITRSK